MSGGITDVSESEFTVLLHDGSRVFEAKGGLTEEHYKFFAPYLLTTDTQLGKAMLAEAVLKNMVRREGCPEPETGLWLLRKNYDHDEDGLDEESWLPELIEAKGFSVIAREMVQAVEGYRKTTPRPKIPKKAMPFWDADLGKLWVGDLLIRQYTDAAQNQRWYLAAFQDAEWRHRVDDSIIRKPGEPKLKTQRRRRDTLAGLNDYRYQINPGIIEFRADGTGDGIIWDWSDE